jgi:uncharacterized protein YbaP (TraB family)
MSRRTAQWTVLAGVCLLLSACVSAPRPAESGKHFLWSVRSGAGTVYLFGSVHIAKPELYPLDPVIEGAFKRADALVVEVNPDRLNEAQRNDLIRRYGVYPGDETLSGALSRETYESASARFTRLGADIGRFEKMKPWLVALVLEMLEFQQLGFDPNYGVDLHFIKQANEGKRIDELETPDFQMRLLGDFSDREQELFLRYTAADLDLITSEMDRLMTAWRRGDVPVFQAIMDAERTRHPEFESIYRKLLDERNRAMAGQVEAFLKTEQTYFVVVGAGHLAGTGGIVDLLRRKGYRVKQL